MKSDIKIEYDGNYYIWRCPMCNGNGFSLTLPESDIICRCSEHLHPASVYAGDFLKSYRKAHGLTAKELSVKIAPKLGREPRTCYGWNKRPMPIAAFRLLLEVAK